jgi:N-succinyldiaminopimelate aminotransferase
MCVVSRRAAAALAGGGVAQVWAEITAMASRPGVLSLGQGAPDMGGSHPVASNAAIEAIAAGSHDQYSPVAGVPELCAAILRYEKRVFRQRQKEETENGEGAPDCRAQVAVASSATEALLASFYAATDPGDEAICVEPCFPWYMPQLAMAGAVPVAVRMKTPHGDAASFQFPLEGIRRAITPRTRLLIHNSPHNPTGAVASAAETAELAQLCVDHDLICVSDEVYHRHTFSRWSAPFLSHPRTLAPSRACPMYPTSED